MANSLDFNIQPILLHKSVGQKNKQRMRKMSKHIEIRRPHFVACEMGQSGQDDGVSCRPIS